MMIKRMALIQDGVVRNIAVWDGVSPWNPEPQYLAVDITSRPDVQIGWLYDGSEFSFQQELE